MGQFKIRFDTNYGEFHKDVKLILLPIRCLFNPKKIRSYRGGGFYSYQLSVKLVLSQRLREVLDDTVSQAQGTFVNGRQVLDVVLIEDEVVEEVRK